jgi:hypothetical protein
MHKFIINFLTTQQDPEIRDRLRIYEPPYTLALIVDVRHTGLTE